MPSAESAAASPRERSFVNGWPLGAVVTAAAVSMAHVHVSSRPGLTGPLLVLDHLFDLAAAAGLLALCAAVGRSAIARLDPAQRSPIEELVLASALGVGLIGTLLLLLAAVGALSLPWMAFILLSCGYAARRELGSLPARTRSVAGELVNLAGSPTLALFVLVSTVATVLALAPATDWDSLMYHLQIPRELLERGAMHVPEGNLHVSYVGPAHLLYVPLLALGADSAPALLNVAFMVALGALCLSVGTRLFSSTTGRLACVLLWGSPMLFLVGITPRIDGMLACYALLGHGLLLRVGDTPGNATGRMALAGAAMGTAVAVKHLALAYVAALAPLVLLVAFRQADQWTGRGRLVAVYGAALLACCLPWLAKNWILLGAPFYPHLAQDVLQPWLASLYGSSELPAAVSTLGTLGAVREPFSLVDWFIAPERLTPEAEGVAYVANRAFLALPFALLLPRRRALWGVLAPGLIFMGAVILYGARLNPRYLTPALPALTLAAAAIVAAAAERTGRTALRASLVLLVVTVGLWPTLGAVVERFRNADPFAHAVGAASRVAYLAEPSVSEAAQYFGLASRVNEATSTEDRILMLFEARGFGFEARTIPDNLLTNWPRLVPLTDEGCLDSSGISHVLVGTGVLGYFRLRGLDPGSIGWDRFPAFSRRCLAPVASGPGWVLYRLGST